MSPRAARRILVRGTVQGVGFRPFVFRSASALELAGWVRNGDGGVEIHVEGAADRLDRFVALLARAPAAAVVSEVEQTEVAPLGLERFEIEPSAGGGRQPTVRIPPDLPVCEACLQELFDPGDRRHGYPYLNCTACGPRWSIVLGLPYDRACTTMRDWQLCARCAEEYHDPEDRRFHAQPTACPDCGPAYVLREQGRDVARGPAALDVAVARLCAGAIVAIKGIGGYHLACDAGNGDAVLRLRTRKVRRERPFALMVADLERARRLVVLDDERSAALLRSAARPVVLAEARAEGRRLRGVAPDNLDLGVMLPYAPLHHLLFARGAPEVLVLTSANRASEPIAYADGDAFERLAGLADAFLVGERPIARRVDDSVVTAGALGPLVLRRSRGWAPGAAARLPCPGPLLAVGADLKNTVTLVIDGEAFVSQHVGDLEQAAAAEAHRETIRDLLAMYRVDCERLVVARDAHPEYRSTLAALELPAHSAVAVQHHRAHVASVLAERGCFEEQVLGVAFDGTGYGDDGTIWGGEIFLGSLASGFERVAHLLPAWLPGGDAAARHPAQAAAGFLARLDESAVSPQELPDLGAPPFSLPDRYFQARRLVGAGVRTFVTTSVGRLFDTVAALLGFRKEQSFEGQAAIWLEHQARAGGTGRVLPLPFDGTRLDHRPMLCELLDWRRRGGDPREIARAFHDGLARGLWQALARLAESSGARVAVLSGGVFQNRLLLAAVADAAGGGPLELWTNTVVPANDGGVSLGQAALACFGAGGRA